jgi:hypothetical protein
MRCGLLTGMLHSIQGLMLTWWRNNFMRGSFWYMDTVAASISISGTASPGTPLNVGLVRPSGTKNGAAHCDDAYITLLLILASSPTRRPDIISGTSLNLYIESAVSTCQNTSSGKYKYRITKPVTKTALCKATIRLMASHVVDLVIDQGHKGLIVLVI